MKAHKAPLRITMCIYVT